MSKSVLPVVKKCAPKIWNKLSAAQQALWVELRNIFINEMIVLNQIRSKRKPLIIEGDFEVVAHNLALEAVWELARQGIVEDRKPAYNTRSAKRAKPRIARA